ncbi:MAG: LPXTG cell wall anchor domain-containing protein, partial [Oscillospiraceae bacterium]|nr:LPXTG cell wall anchor domain-containing protein [Oscillospiraceae bacterium]
HVVENKKVSININLDNREWDTNIVLVDIAENEYALAFFDFKDLPDGDYKIYIDGKYTGRTLTVGEGGANTTLDFYTLTLVAGTGIEKIIGEGVYLAGSAVDISALLMPGYKWDKWIVTEGNYDAVFIDGISTQIIMPDGPLSLLAFGALADNAVTGETKNPATGDDDNNLLNWIIVLFSSSAFGAYILVYRNRKRWLLERIL